MNLAAVLASAFCSYTGYLSTPARIPLQAELPEEDMDVRGGGAAAEDARIVKAGYESDDEAEEKRWPGHHISAAPMHLVSCSTARPAVLHTCCNHHDDSGHLQQQTSCSRIAADCVGYAGSVMQSCSCTLTTSKVPQKHLSNSLHVPPHDESQN